MGHVVLMKLNFLILLSAIALLIRPGSLLSAISVEKSSDETLVEVDDGEGMGDQDHSDEVEDGTMNKEDKDDDDKDDDHGHSDEKKSEDDDDDNDDNDDKESPKKSGDVTEELEELDDAKDQLEEAKEQHEQSENVLAMLRAGFVLVSHLIMAAPRCLFPLTFVAACHAGAMLRQEWLSSVKGGATQSEMQPSGADQYPEMWYTGQTLDHFNPQDTRTFSQRYFANFDNFKPGGPIFINIGGEGPASSKLVSGYLSNALFAKTLNGGTVAVEHRFYGKTQPFDSLATENLAYLTSRQALHDLAQFQKWFTASNSSFSGSKFFCMGGSYPGNLAAWYRLEFPNMTAGCWAASGPVHAQENWPGFGEKVWQAVATDTSGIRNDDVSTKLYAGYAQLAGLIQDPTPQAQKHLVDIFNVCPGTLVSQGDRDNFEMTVSTYPGLIMQYNNTHTPHLAAIRDIVISAKTALDAALNVSNFLGLMVGSGPNNCTDNSIGTFYASLMDSALPKTGEGNAGRTWTWQTCNEFGYFQTATSKFAPPTMYTRGASARALWQQVCNDVFGIDDASIGARIAETNRYYGGKDPAGISRVLFSNGELDGWSLLSITSYPPNTRDVYTEVAPLGSHCVGLYPPTENEVPGATAIRAKAFSLFQMGSQCAHRVSFFQAGARETVQVVRPLFT